ncbi:toll/interleukin-1 receptor domain-containing protein [Urbifossiella limnaea]|uniref:TIR domain-containing protein n=1 Tax=Urbifossiella limnaea TaxID=2528023 RepID=A0A517XN56_9BACT|nr:toll/interleukin-1 receptor domain-containing protein [Urbifossiella limnaea]QDU18945.1 hypothetical protein ETAA1_08440 [Urbifossiella limnaea]
MTRPTCSFCESAVPDGGGFCPRCGGEVPEHAGETLLLLQLQAVRTTIRARALGVLGPAVRAAAELLGREPGLAARCADALVWTGREAFRLLDEDAGLSRTLPAAELVAGLLPPTLYPELRTHVADHQKVRDAFVRAEAGWKQGGPPSARKARAWFDALADKSGFDPKGLRACVYAAPHQWPTVAAALDADAFEAARALREVAAGDAEFAQKNYGRARACYAAARKAEPSAAAADGLARCAAATGDPAGAVAHSREAVRLGSTDPFTFNRLAWTLCTTGTPTSAGVGEAVRAARRAVELAPATAAFWDTLAEALERAGDLHGAAAAARESLRWGRGKDAYQTRMDRLCALLPAPASDDEIDLSGSPRAGENGVELARPADSGVALGRSPGADDGGDLELSLEADSSEAGPVSAKPRPTPKLPVSSDSDSEFELTLDDSADAGSLGNLESAALDDEGKWDNFETDFEIPNVSDESGCEAVARESDADSEESSEDIVFDDEDGAGEDDSSASGEALLADDEDEDSPRASMSRPRRSARDDEADARPAKPTGGWRTPAAGAAKPTGGWWARLTGRGGRAEVPKPATDQVHFSVTAPAVMQPGRAYVIDAWAHLAAQRQEVLERAREAQRGGPIASRTKGGMEVARGTTVAVHLRVPTLVIDDPEDTILWTGEIGNATFPVRVPANTPAGAQPGTLRVFASGLEVAKLHFELEVGAAEAPPAPVAARERRHRTAFASYASPDRDAVLARVQGIQKVLPDLDVFVDVAALRSGDRWAERLEKEVVGRDVFYLFWSAHARASDWVRREWQTALAARGVEYIDPVPLAPPDQVAPPPELAAHLHFNDWVLAYTRGRPTPPG